jgi:hypothetical protein
MSDNDEIFNFKFSSDQCKTIQPGQNNIHLGQDYLIENTLPGWINLFTLIINQSLVQLPTQDIKLSAVDIILLFSNLDILILIFIVQPGQINIQSG